MAQAVGIDPKTVNYVAYDGGGELLTALLGGQIAFGVSGAGEFADQIEAGQVRVLAVTGAERIPDVDAPDPARGRRRHGVHQLARHRRPARRSATQTSRRSPS